MAQDQFDDPVIVEAGTLTICTPSATSDNTTMEFQKSDDLRSSIPWPGRTFIIRSQQNGQVITFLDGQIILDKPGGLGTFRWRCVEKKGWVGFQDPASAMYLGSDDRGWLRCAANKHSDWEYVCPRKRPEGGYVLSALVEKELLPLGVHSKETNSGLECRIRVGDWKSEGIAWDFVEL
jgi:hypothetical protein